ncbi:MAG TPA: helix-hairpin-helix domain-containing protein [Gemmatimonadales bacterium]|nr:helix-hairpin-helix domain-containing protein [Gemmatimonadales bacterium]
MTRRGVALVFVLWLLVLLGAAATEVAAHVRAEGRVVTTLETRTIGRYAAESGILMATAAIESRLDSTTAPGDRVTALRDPELRRSLAEVALGDARFGVAIVDLNARLDLNRTDERTLRNLFSEFTSPARAEAIVTALKRESLSRLAELARVPGMDDSLALAVAPYVTVWGDGLVDVNAAPAPVLAAVPGIGSATAAAIVAQRDGGHVFGSTDDLRSAEQANAPTSGPGEAGAVVSPLLTLSPTRLLLVSRGWQPGQPLTHEIQAVYLVLGHWLVLQQWEEHDR